VAKVATNADDVAGTPPVEDGQQPPADDQNQQQPQDDGQQGGEVAADDLENDPVAKIAMEIGWTPKDRYSGPAENWKDAATFIREGRNIQRNDKRELTSLRQQIDVIARTNAEIMADRLAAQRAELTERYNQQVEDGDARGSIQTAQRLIEIENRAKQPVGQPAPSPAAMEFQERNAHWFGKDQAATVRAQSICNDLAARGVTDHAEQLKAAERVLRNEYPEYFTNQQNGQQRPNPPAVSQPGARGAPPTNRQKGFADMPKAAQDIANDLASRGLIPDKQAYVNRYWQNEGTK
jgi:hypothetical protein